MTKQAIKEKSEQKLLEIILEMWIKGDSELSRTVEVSHNPDEKILKLDSRTMQIPRFSHLGDPHRQDRTQGQTRLATSSGTLLGYMGWIADMCD